MTSALRSTMDVGGIRCCGGEGTTHVSKRTKGGGTVSSGGTGEGGTGILAEQEFCRIVQWKTLQKKPPRNLKISPLAAVPHKLRSWRAILDLSSELEVNCKRIPLVNDASEALAPEAALNQMGDALLRLIVAVAEALADRGDIVFAKLDLKDGYWRLSVERGAEWNFAYVLPPVLGQDPEDVELVIPLAVQMGWRDSGFLLHSTKNSARCGQ